MHKSLKLNIEKEMQNCHPITIPTQSWRLCTICSSRIAHLKAGRNSGNASPSSSKIRQFKLKFELNFELASTTMESSDRPMPSRHRCQTSGSYPQALAAAPQLALWWIISPAAHSVATTTQNISKKFRASIWDHIYLLLGALLELYWIAVLQF